MIGEILFISCIVLAFVEYITLKVGWVKPYWDDVAFNIFRIEYILILITTAIMGLGY